MNRGFAALVFSLISHLVIFFILGRLFIDRSRPVTEFRLFGNRSVVFDLSSVGENGGESGSGIPPKTISMTSEWTPGAIPVPVPVAVIDSGLASIPVDSGYAGPPSLAYRPPHSPPFGKRLSPDAAGNPAGGDSSTVAEKAADLIQTWKKQYNWDETVPRQDMAGDAIAERNLGGGPRASQIPPPQPKEKDIESKFDFLPSTAQVSAMSVLFNKKKATQSELYAQIPPDLPITQEMLNREMDMLIEKGFVKRKQVSPQNILYVFGMPFEMSSKNRKNPVYLYKPNVGREKLMAFLYSRIYLFN
jgi:hypothetical protein